MPLDPFSVTCSLLASLVKGQRFAFSATYFLFASPVKGQRFAFSATNFLFDSSVKGQRLHFQGSTRPPVVAWGVAMLAWAFTALWPARPVESRQHTFAGPGASQGRPLPFEGSERQLCCLKPRRRSEAPKAV